MQSNPLNAPLHTLPDWSMAKQTLMLASPDLQVGFVVFVSVGDNEGRIEGTCDGGPVGSNVSIFLVVGIVVGSSKGFPEGTEDGRSEGDCDDASVGSNVSFEIVVGSAVGCAIAFSEGAKDGGCDGD